MPKLLVIRGEGTGNEYDLHERATLGRAPECDIVIGDDGVSDQHAEIVKSNDLYLVRNLSGRNATYVDGERIVESPLKSGSHITISRWTAVFIDESALPDALDGAQRVAWVDDEHAPPTEASLDTAKHTRARDALQNIGDPRALRDRLKLLDDVGQLTHTLRDTDELLTEVARLCLFAFADCDACFILVQTDSAAQPIIKAALTRTEQGVGSIGDAQPRMSLSRTVVNKALKSKRSILRSDVPKDAELRGATSVVKLGIQSVLCAPLIRDGEAFGVIYLDSRRSRATFAESDLGLLSAIANEAALAIENARLYEELKMAKECLGEENLRLRQEIGDEFRFEGIIGSSPGMREAIERAKKVSLTDADVLITGESGVGKELFARAIHYNSPRRAEAFEDFNCAVGESLIESELFGIGSWAATGVRPRAGLFERANGGTVFLDEIGDMPLATQAKLLRALQERTIKRVGTGQNIKLNVRIIAATSKDLMTEIEAGGFRSDLYHRLAVVRIHVPPLRERREDTLRLAEHFLTKYSLKYGKSIDGFSLAAQRALVSYSWDQNNVRELEKRIEEMIALAGEGTLIDTKDLPPEIAKASGIRIPRPPRRGPMKEAVAEFEKEIISEKLKERNGNIMGAARDLGLSQQGLRNKIDELRLWEVVEKARGRTESGKLGK